MSNLVNLQELFSDLQNEMIATLQTNRKNVSHPSAKGDSTELHWLNMLNNYLPNRYKAEKAFIVDSNGDISDQMDVVIFDRQYSPFLFNHEGTYYVPAESVYAVFEAKQEMNKQTIEYAGKKAESVRKLHRTSAHITHAGGTFPPRQVFEILSGILTLDSSWNPPLGKSFEDTLNSLEFEQRLNLGCCLQGGAFECKFEIQRLIDIDTKDGKNTLIFFFLSLLEKLQSLGTVPAIEFSEYAKFIRIEDKN